MAGDPSKSRGPRPKESSGLNEWYAVTSDGRSALRLTAGLVVGETGTGALALNDADQDHQWIEFVVDDAGDPWVTVVSRERSLSLDGQTSVRQRLGEGVEVRFPHNTLYISRDILMPTMSGSVIEVVARDVPGCPQDLAGPGWAEALASVREPAAGAPATEIPEAPHSDSARAGPVAAGRRAGAEAVDDPAADILAESATDRAADVEDAPAAAAPAGDGVARRDPHASRRGGRRGRMLVMLAVLAVGAVTLGGAAALLLSLDSETGRAGGEVDTAFEPAAPPPAPDGVGSSSAGPLDDLPRREAPPTDDPAPEQPAAARPQGEDPVAQRPASKVPADTAPGETPAAETPAAETPVADLPVTEAPAPEPAADAPAADDWRLVRARELLEEGYVSYPPRDNAVAYLQRLLAEQPDHPEALALLDESADALIAAAERAHDQGLDYEARNTLEEVLGFDPDNERAQRLWNEWVESGR